MCLIIVKPPKVEIPEDDLRLAWQSNCDGAGFAFSTKKEVKIVKGFMAVKDFLTSYNEHTKKFKNSVFLIHFRVRTYGDKSEMNTHPFEINGGAMAHNGGFTGTGAQTMEGPSDTNLFAQRYKDVLTYEHVKQHKVGWGQAVGYNKIALLYPENKYLIINENDGIWDKEAWYSQMFWKTRVANWRRHLTQGVED